MKTGSAYTEHGSINPSQPNIENIASQLKNNDPFLTKLDLNYPLASRTLIEILNALSQNTITTQLTLSGQKIGNKEVYAITNTIRANNTLSSIAIHKAEIQIKHLRNTLISISQNTTLKHISLQECSIGDAEAATLEAALRSTGKTLKSLNLNKNKLTRNSAESIISILTSAQLEELHILNNSINQEGTATIFHASATCPNLKKLEIGYTTHMGIIGSTALAQMLQQSESLTSLTSTSNLCISPVFPSMASNQYLKNAELSIHDTDPHGPQMISNMLSENKALTHLKLYIRNIAGENKTTDSIMAGLIENKTLQLFHCDYLYMRPSIASMITNNNSLTNLSLDYATTDTHTTVTILTALKNSKSLTSYKAWINHTNSLEVDALAKVIQHNKTLTNLTALSNSSSDTMFLNSTETLTEAITRNKIITTFIYRRGPFIHSPGCENKSPALLIAEDRIVQLIERNNHLFTTSMARLHRGRLLAPLEEQTILAHRNSEEFLKYEGPQETLARFKTNLSNIANIAEDISEYIASFLSKSDLTAYNISTHNLSTKIQYARDEIIAEAYKHSPTICNSLMAHINGSILLASKSTISASSIAMLAEQSPIIFDYITTHRKASTFFANNPDSFTLLHNLKSEATRVITILESEQSTNAIMQNPSHLRQLLQASSSNFTEWLQDPKISGKRARDDDNGRTL